MPEIKTEIKTDADGNFLIEDKHTVADIIRFAMQQGNLDAEEIYYIAKTEQTFSFSS